jgi:hypothetical protein
MQSRPVVNSRPPPASSERPWPGGATIARELSGKGKTVVLWEVGKLYREIPIRKLPEP